MAERGPGAVTVREVVARADASVGAFYARFDGKDAALAYVRRTFWREVRALWSRFLDPAPWDGVPADVVVAESIRRFVRAFLDPRRHSRAFLLEVLGEHGSETRARVHELDEHVAASLGELLALRSDEPGGEPTEPVERALPIVLGGVRDFLLFGHAARPEGADPPGAPARSAPPGGRRAQDTAERELILGAVQMLGAMLGLERVPRDYGELLRLCSHASHVRLAESAPADAPEIGPARGRPGRAGPDGSASVPDQNPGT